MNANETNHIIINTFNELIKSKLEKQKMLNEERERIDKEQIENQKSIEAINIILTDIGNNDSSTQKDSFVSNEQAPIEQRNSFSSDSFSFIVKRAVEQLEGDISIASILSYLKKYHPSLHAEEKKPYISVLLCSLKNKGKLQLKKAGGAKQAAIYRKTNFLSASERIKEKKPSQAAKKHRELISV